MNTKHSNWSQFKLRVNIKAEIADIYDAWATPAGLESWFLRSAKFVDNHGNLRGKEIKIGKGDIYEWLWHGYPDEVVEKGTILEANGTDKFTFTFSLNCPVAISLYHQAGESIVELVESNLPTDEETMARHYVGDSRGWIFYLTNLKSVLEGGLDLRNRKTELVNVITA